MDKFLPLLVSYMVVLQNKLHNIHTGSKGTGLEFRVLHPIVWEIYAIFGDDAIDEIRERAGQLHIAIPNNLTTMLSECKIQELGEYIPSISESSVIVYKDLCFMKNMLQAGIEQCDIEKDIVTQNILADLQKEIWVFVWKYEMGNIGA